MAHFGRAHGRHAVRQLVRLLQLDQRIKVDSDHISVGEPARDIMMCVCVRVRQLLRGERVLCRRLGRAVRARALHAPPWRAKLHTHPRHAEANSSDLRTIPTISTLFCNQRNPVIDP